MKCIATFATAALASAVAPQIAEARDTKHLLSIKEVLRSDEAKEKLGGDVKFYFGSARHPKPSKELGEFTANRKTNSFNKSDEKACKWVFLSALISLRDRALREGGNAVVGIHSFYKKSAYRSKTKFECHAGNVVAGVALRGTVVRFGKAR